MLPSTNSSEPIFNVPVKANCTAGLVVKVLYGADEVCDDVLVVHGRPKCRMLFSVEYLLEVYTYKFLLVLKESLAQIPQIEDLRPALNSACSSAIIASA